MIIPTTTLTYYAVDFAGGLLSFASGDRAFVRILGVTHEYTQNTEIFHPLKLNGEIDDRIFTGNITIKEPGIYLIKICLGKSINLDAKGNMIWPFGCFEDSTSEEIEVY